MRHLIGFLCVCALGLMPLIGCSETAGIGGSGGSAGDGGTGGMGGDGGSGGMGGTVELFLITYESDGWGAGPPLEGVVVCQTDTPNCTTSDVNGEARLLLPANQEISYTMTKDGHMGWMAGDVTDERFGAEGQQPHPGWRPPPWLASATVSEGIRHLGSGKDLKSLAAALACYVLTSHA